MKVCFLDACKVERVSDLSLRGEGALEQLADEALVRADHTGAGESPALLDIESPRSGVVSARAQVQPQAAGLLAEGGDLFNKQRAPRRDLPTRRRWESRRHCGRRPLAGLTAQSSLSAEPVRRINADQRTTGRRR